MSMNLFIKILGKIKDYRHITLSGMGEPMLHHNFLSMCYVARDKGFEVFVITNGSKLTVPMFQELDKIGVNIRVSWYGKKEQREILDEIFKLPRKIKLNLHFTPMVAGQSDSVQFIEDFKDKADQIEIWTPHNWGDTFKYREVKNQASCPRIKRDPLQIHVNGDVVACTVDWDSQLVYGNLDTQTLDEVFESELYARLKRDEYDGLICETCDFRNEDKEEVLYYSTWQGEDRGNKTSTCYEEL